MNTKHAVFMLRFVFRWSVIKLKFNIRSISDLVNDKLYFKAYTIPSYFFNLYGFTVVLKVTKEFNGN